MANQKRCKIIEISHGNIEDESEGHFIHANNVTKAFSTFADIKVLEYSTDSKRVTKDKIIYQHLNIYPKGKSNETLLSKLISFDPISLLKEQYFSVKLLKVYKEEIMRADYILLQGCLLVSAFLLCVRYKKKIIIDTHWINYDVARQKRGINPLAYSLRLTIWKVIESYMFKRAHKLLILSEKDLRSARTNLHARDSQLILIPQVIDFGRYSSQASEIKKVQRSKQPVAITFIGTLSSIQNQKALHYITSDLAPAFTNCDFKIYGASQDGAEDNVYFFKARSDIMSYLVKSDILISPVDVGSGTKFKVLDYLYAQKLIIATPPNFDGIPYAIDLNGVMCAELKNFKDALAKAVENKTYTQFFKKHREMVLKYNSKGALESTLQAAFTRK